MRNSARGKSLTFSYTTGCVLFSWLFLHSCYGGETRNDTHYSIFIGNGYNENITTNNLEVMTLITMTVSEAQNGFSVIMDASQREPIIVTRDGKPVSVMIPMNNFEDLPLSVMKEISRRFPMRGEEAARAIQEVLSRVGNRAEEDGLTEDDVTRIVHELR